MPRLTPLHWKKLICAFKKLGYEQVRQESSHIMLKIKGKRPLVIPTYDSVGLDITRLIRTAGIDRDKFLEMLVRRSLID